MEINSGEVRGGGVLKKRVLESTQSHSSVALMKKREQSAGLLKSVGKAKEFFDEESSSDEEEESSSLTVILIDEGEGAGFICWPTQIVCLSFLTLTTESSRIIPLQRTFCFKITEIPAFGKLYPSSAKKPSPQSF